MHAHSRRILTTSALIAMVIALATMAVMSGSAEADAAPALDDPTIVAIFDAANTYDIETGALAAKKGRSAEVREYGEMLVRDHRHVRTLGRDLAKSLRVTPTPPQDFPLAKVHTQAMRTLERS